VLGVGRAVDANFILGRFSTLRGSGGAMVQKQAYCYKNEAKRKLSQERAFWQIFGSGLESVEQ
jgi:hypothetical protein